MREKLAKAALYSATFLFAWMLAGATASADSLFTPESWVIGIDAGTRKDVTVTRKSDGASGVLVQEDTASPFATLLLRPSGKNFTLGFSADLFPLQLDKQELHKNEKPINVGTSANGYIADVVLELAWFVLGTGGTKGGNWLKIGIGYGYGYADLSGSVRLSDGTNKPISRHSGTGAGAAFLAARVFNHLFLDVYAAGPSWSDEDFQYSAIGTYSRLGLIFDF